MVGLDLNILDSQQFGDPSTGEFHLRMHLQADTPIDADRLEAEGEDFHAAIRTHFLDRAAAHPTRYLVVDGTLDPQAIHARVLERLVADRLIGTAT